MNEVEFALIFWTYEKAYNAAIDQWQANGVGERVTNQMAHQAGLMAVIELSRKEPDDGKSELV